MKTSLLTIALALATMSLSFGQTPAPAAPAAPAANGSAKAAAKTTTTKKHHKKAAKKAVKATGAAVTPSAKSAVVAK